MNNLTNKNEKKTPNLKLGTLNVSNMTIGRDS